MRSPTTAPCASRRAGGSLSEIYNLFTSIHRLSTCLFFHINLSLANSCLWISYNSPGIKNSKYASSIFVVFNICDFFQASSQTIVYFLPVAGINLSNIQHHILDQKKKRFTELEQKKEGINILRIAIRPEFWHFLKTIDKLQIVMSGNPTGILALFALLPSSVVSIPVHYRPFHTLFFYSKALQTFPLSHIPDSSALRTSLAFSFRNTNTLFSYIWSPDDDTIKHRTKFIVI